MKNKQKTKNKSTKIEENNNVHVIYLFFREIPAVIFLLAACQTYGVSIIQILKDGKPARGHLNQVSPELQVLEVKTYIFIMHFRFFISRNMRTLKRTHKAESRYKK